jgi:hypothetical protein
LRGPFPAAAVILKPGTRITGIDDSKKLDANSREALAKEIKQKAASGGSGPMEDAGLALGCLAVGTRLFPDLVRRNDLDAVGRLDVKSTKLQVMLLSKNLPATEHGGQRCNDTEGDSPNNAR